MFELLLDILCYQRYWELTLREKDNQIPFEERSDDPELLATIRWLRAWAGAKPEQTSIFASN